MIWKKQLVPLALSFTGILVSGTLQAGEPKPIPEEQFANLHRMIKPQSDESKFWQIPWLIQLDKALEKGAAEGKPIWVWSGAGGAPVGVC